MDRVQRRGGRARHPGRVRPGAQMPDLLDHHLAHQVGRGPHALADLRPARQAACQTDPNIARLIGLEPGGVLHCALAHHRPRPHRGMNLVARTVEEACIDEDDPVFHRVDAGGEIGRCAPFLVHHADLDRVPFKPQQILHRIEQIVGEGAFFRPMHLGLHDVDAAAARIAMAAQLCNVLRADRAGDDGIHDAFGDFLPVPAHRWVGHQMPDIAHEHQAAAGQRMLRPLAVGPDHIAGEFARDGAPAFFETLRQVAAHDAQPVAIGDELVLGIHCRDRILAIRDRRQRSFENDIRDAEPVRLADLAVGVDDQFDMQPVMPEQRPAIRPADVLCRIGEFDGIEVCEIGPAPAGERHDLVEQPAPFGDHRSPALLVVAARLRRRRIEHVGPVKRIVQAAPARIGGIEQEACIEDRNHQLRPRHGRDLGIDVLRADGEISRFGNEIADLLQECAIGAAIVRLARMFAVPGIDLRLQILALGKQGGVARREFLQQRGKALPEPVDIAAQRAKHFGFDEIGKLGVGFDPGARYVLCHETPRGQMQSWQCRTRGGTARSMPPAVDQCKARGGLGLARD